MSKEILAIALCRVSSIEQLQNNSLKHQKDNVLRAAESLGATIPSDGIWEGQQSSKQGVNFNRKDLLEMFEYCKRHTRVRYLIVQEVDRFMRSPEEQTYWYVRFWYELKVRVWYADKPELNEDTHVASLLRFMEGWRAGGSNLERKNKSINGQTAALKEGRWTFVPKPGYMKGEIRGIPDIHPVRGKELQRNLKRLAAGYVGPTKGLIELNKSNFTQNHAPYKMDKYRKIATDIFYAGIIDMDVQVKVSGVKGLHKPLITLEEHYRLVEVFDNKPKYQIGPKRNGNPKFPLNNLMEHESCIDLKNKGRLVGYDHTNGKYKKIYQKYRCRSCNEYWHKQDVDSKVTDLFNRYEMSPATQRKIIEALQIVWIKDRENKVHEERSIRLAMANLEKIIEQKVESATDDTNSAIKDDILKIIEKKKDELSNLEQQLKKLNSKEEEDKQQFMEFALSFIQETGKHFLEPYLTKEYRMVCKQMLFPAGIYINPDGKVYTPEASVFYRGEGMKKDAEASEISHLVPLIRPLSNSTVQRRIADLAAQTSDLSHTCESPEPSVPPRNRAIALTDSEEADLIAAYLAGEERSSLRERFGISERTLVRYVARAKVTRSKRRMSPEQVAEAAELYAQGKSLKELGERYGLNDETVRVRLREVGVVMRRRG